MLAITKFLIEEFSVIGKTGVILYCQCGLVCFQTQAYETDYFMSTRNMERLPEWWSRVKKAVDLLSSALKSKYYLPYLTLLVALLLAVNIKLN
mgnify:CR=1 FL=1